MSQSIQNAPGQNEFDRSSGALAEEATLRLIATLPAPDGLEERMKRELRSAPRGGRVIAWPFSSAVTGSWMRSAGMRTAAAAGIVLLIGGGGWGVYSHIHPATSPTAVYGPLPLNGGRGGFGAAGAKRVPQTLEGPVLAKPATAKDKAEPQSTTVVPPKHGKRAAVKKSAGETATAR